MKKTIVLLAFALMLQMTLAGDVLKIVSLDVVNRAEGDSLMPWMDRSTDLCIKLHQSKAALIALQDVDSLQMVDIKQGLPEYTLVAGYDVTGASGKSTNPILFDSKVIKLAGKGVFWLSDTPEVASCSWNSDKESMLCWTMLQEVKTGKSMLLVNAHLEGVQESEMQRAATFIKNYLSKMTNKTPVVLLGNFGDAHQSAFYTSILQRYFVLHDCYMMSKPKGEPSSLNELCKDRTDECLRTDYAFVGSDVKVKAVKVESTKTKTGYLSVHNFLNIDISLK